MEPDLSGTVIGGKYRIQQLLGQGGMGLVYAAEHTLLGRPLAVKLLKHEFTRDRVAVHRFQQEAVNASRIGSPNIVAIHDLGETDDGTPFIVMEYLEGTTLYAVMGEDPATGANGVFEVPQAADLLCQVLAGLAAAHQHGIVHRDLKPGNIFLTEVGGRTNFVKLLDFGVSKVLGGDRVMHMTRTGVLLGTPTYMAPEQVMGRKDIDHRVDLWAAGVILFRLLAGRRPHGGSVTAERLAAIVSQDAPPLRSLRPDLDAGLEGLLRKALARDPASRFQTAYDFAEALEPYRAPGPVPLSSTFTLAPAPPVAGPLRPAPRLAAGAAEPPAAGVASPLDPDDPAMASTAKAVLPPAPPTTAPPPAPAAPRQPQVLLRSGTFDQPTTALPAPALPVVPIGMPTPDAVPWPAPAATRPRVPARRTGIAATTWVSIASLVVIALSIAVILAWRLGSAGDGAPAAETASPAPPAATTAPASAPPAAEEAADIGRYVAAAVALGCRNVSGSAAPGAGPGLPPQDVLETFGLTRAAWIELSNRFAGDPAVQERISEEVRRCVPRPP